MPSAPSAPSAPSGPPAIEYRKLPPPYREAVAFFDAFRRFGFPAEDIFAVLAGKDGRVQLCISLRTRDRFGKDAEVVAVAGFLPGTRKEVDARWAAIVDAVRGGHVPQADLDTAWATSMACAQLGHLPRIFADKNIDPPVLDPDAPFPAAPTGTLVFADVFADPATKPGAPN